MLRTFSLLIFSSIRKDQQFSKLFQPDIIGMKIGRIQPQSGKVVCCQLRDISLLCHDPTASR